MSKYHQGDIVIIRFPFTDLSSSKKRPALIISNEVVNQTGDYLLMQITSKEMLDKLSMPIVKTDFTGHKALPLNSFVRLHKIFLLNEQLVVGKATSVRSEFIKMVIIELDRLLM